MDADTKTGKKLFPMHAIFAQEFPVDLNATKAAIRAGYSERTAYSQGQRLLKNVEVQRAITRAFADRTERIHVDADWVVAKLVGNVERAMQAVPVFDRQGNPTGTYVYDGHVANGALKLLGEHLRMFDGPVVNNDNRQQTLIFQVIYDNASLPSPIEDPIFSANGDGSGSG